MRITRTILTSFAILSFCFASISHSAEEQTVQTVVQPVVKEAVKPVVRDAAQAVMPSAEQPEVDGIEYYQITGDKDFSGYAQYDHLTQRVIFVINNNSDCCVNLKSATYAANIAVENRTKIYAIKFEQLEMNSSYDNKTYLVNPGGACRLVCVVPPEIAEIEGVHGYFILVPNQYGWFDREIRFGYQVGALDEVVRFWKNLRLKIRKVIGLR